MREFKFRVWDIEDCKMYTMGSFYQEGNYMFDSDYPVVEFYRDETPDNKRCNTRDKVRIMQYTGLKDRDGIEVYEGDILSHTKSGKEYICKVVYSNSGFYTHGINFRTINPLATSNKRVVGNIYENPELLGD